MPASRVLNVNNVVPSIAINLDMAAEVAGLTVGAVVLASLFSTCIECFDYLKSTQDFRRDYRLLLVKLDLEKTRLLIWGNAVGILEAFDEGRSPLL